MTSWGDMLSTEQLMAALVKSMPFADFFEHFLWLVSNGGSVASAKRDGTVRVTFILPCGKGGINQLVVLLNTTVEDIEQPGVEAGRLLLSALKKLRAGLDSDEPE